LVKWLNCLEGIFRLMIKGRTLHIKLIGYKPTVILDEGIQSIPDFSIDPIVKN